jgi:hypothetical protein
LGRLGCGRRAKCFFHADAAWLEVAGLRGSDAAALAAGRGSASRLMIAGGEPRRARRRGLPTMVALTRLREALWEANPFAETSVGTRNRREDSPPTAPIVGGWLRSARKRACTGSLADTRPYAILYLHKSSTELTSATSAAAGRPEPAPSPPATTSTVRARRCWRRDSESQRALARIIHRIANKSSLRCV